MATVLVVDDDGHIREVVRFALSAAGYVVLEAADGRAALDLFERERPDALVLDIVMPEEDGLTVCRQLRAKSDVPILFLSSRDDELDRILGLEMGALGVVLQTTLSGVTALPLATFALILLPIHLLIGIVEGIVTAGVVTFVWKARPEILEMEADPETIGRPPVRTILATFLVAPVVTGGGLSWFASTRPDGLEWSMFRVSGKEELESPEKGPHAVLGRIQEKTALLPDYGFKGSETEAPKGTESSGGDPWPGVLAGTSASGVIGALITMVFAFLIGVGLRRYHRRN